MASLYKDDGYLVVDHRASPGIPADLAQAVGFDPRHCGEGKVLETATLSCSHCRCCVVINPLRTRERAYCTKCDHYICDVCAFQASQPDYQHLPYNKLADETWERAEKRIIVGSPHPLVAQLK